MTLSLAALKIYAPPAAIIEPLIALSIVLVGVDNLLVGDGATASRDLRPWMAGLFGLVHGFGFASVLARVRPAPTRRWAGRCSGSTSASSCGQLAFVLPIAALLASIRGRSALVGARLAMVGSVVVALAGAYWFVQRVFFPGSGA